MTGKFVAKRWLVFCVFFPYALSLFLGQCMHSLLADHDRSCNRVTGRMSACRSVCRDADSHSSRMSPSDPLLGKASGLVCAPVHSHGDEGTECPVCQLLSFLYCGPSFVFRPNGHDLITHLRVGVEQRNDHDVLDLPTNRGPPSEQSMPLS